VLVAGVWRALVRTAADEAAAGTPALRMRTEVYQAARWRAARYGIGGTLVDPVECRTAPAREVVGRFLAYLDPALDQAGDRDEVHALAERALDGGNGAVRQRAALARRGEMADVMALLLA